MRALIFLPMLLIGCSEPEPSRPTSGASPIVGLYERAGVPDRPSRICIVGQGAQTRFGLNASYEGPESCTAKGRVQSTGPVLTFAIDGDPACRLAATKTATGLLLNAPEGRECAYYCGRNTGLDAGPFEKVGDTEADARKAVDLVGEPLC